MGSSSSFMGSIKLADKIIEPKRIFVYGKPVDMRKSFDGLIAMVSQQLAEDVMSGDLYIFLNRRKNYAKCLIWDRTGFIILAKRLEKGQFRLRNKGDKLLIQKAGLRLLLDGMPIGGVEISRSKDIQHGPSSTRSTDDSRGDSYSPRAQQSTRNRR